MEKKFKFTNERIKALPANPPDAKGTDLEVSDTEVIGLKCLSGKSGNKRWLLRYSTNSGRKTSIALGRFPDIDVTLARKIARKHLQQIAEGHDPKAERDEIKKIPTVSQFFWDIYLPLIKGKNKSWKLDQQRFEYFIGPAFGDMRFEEVTAAQVQQFQLGLKLRKRHGKPYTPATCNRILALLKTMSAHAVRLGLVEINQAAKIQLFRENNVRTRFLDLEESQALIQVARNYKKPAVGALVIMLLLTGCRSSEMRYATYDNLDLNKRTLIIPPEQTKNKRGRVVYLTDLALETLAKVPKIRGNPYIFPGTKKGRPIADIRFSFRAMLLQAGITDVENICVHTLRHTTASNMVSAGFSLNEVKAQLAHQSIQSSERYAKLSLRSIQNTSQKVSDLFQI